MESNSIVISPVFRNGESVYVIGGIDQVPHTIIGILVTPHGLMYNARSISSDRFYYDFEISKEKNVML